MTENFEKYADLLLIRCLNLKEKIRPLLISAPIKAIDFIQVLTNRAYELGVTDIYFDWEDNGLKREQLLHLGKEDLLESSFWNKKIFDEYAKKDAAFLMLYSDAPEMMKDIPSEKISITSHQFRASRPYYKKRQSTDDVPWCIAIVATEEYAKQVFPDKENALELTWDAIFKCCLVYEDDPIEAWNEKTKLSYKKSSLLNNYRFRYLHYTNNLGTDLVIELPKNHIWCGAGDGPLIVNMPTEEVFTTPLRTGVNGTIYSARPLVYGGSLIENFSFRLENGKIVEINAEKGKEILENMIASDDNSCYLGEVALVDYDSPISNMNIVFYETLYDENASCHLAIGDGFPKCYENGENMSREELLEQGVNHSTVHTDFMVGTSDLKIIGTTWDGEEYTVFENGNFVLKES